MTTGPFLPGALRGYALFPTDGYVGFVGRLSARDTIPGDDVLAVAAGESPVVAPMMVPDPPGGLNERHHPRAIRSASPGEQIWLYYTHMADVKGQSYISEQFPPGSMEIFTKAGTLLGSQGNYSGDPNNPTGIHLHFSIVKDDGTGKFENELERKNTYDPSPYLGLYLNGFKNKEDVPVCPPLEQSQ